MGGKSFTHQKKILIFGAAVVAFFVLQQEAYAFGHPDVISPSVEISGPDPGTPFQQTPPTISYNAVDTYSGTMGVCKLFKRDTGRDSGWVFRTDIPCGEDRSVVTDGSWCTTEGTNTCGIRIVGGDSAGHTSRDERFFTVDRTPPVIEISSNRTDPTQKVNAKFQFSASDAYGISGLRCKLDVDISGTGEDERTFTLCGSSKSYSGIPDGFRTFTVEATDKAGNKAQKSIAWEIDSIPPAKLSNFTAFGATYFSEILDWLAPKEDGPKGGVSAQYDIRYSTKPISESNWDGTTALIYSELATGSPESQQRMTIGPRTIDDLEQPRNLGLLSKFNLLSANTKHYFGIKTRDEKWNWSGISRPTNTEGLWTLRDPCDYDADQLYSAKEGCGPRKCNPSTQTCDLYDYPPDWELPGPWPADKAPDKWIRTFGATAKDLDQDGEDVASTRTGVRVSGHPQATGRDWYDNPFTLDLLSLATLPTLKQLSYTINDLDLDTFASRDWIRAVGLNEPSEPAEADLWVAGEEKSGGGCQYPDAREGTCFNCTAYNPDPATGRIPSGKIEATTHKKRTVCQIEAYYTDLKDAVPPAQPFEVIQETLTAGGTINIEKEIIAASANCRDGLDNDLDKGIDSSEDPRKPTRDFDCPTIFDTSGSSQFQSVNTVIPEAKNRLTAAIFPKVGIVQCGRHADDYTTPIDESANCGFCELFVLVGNLINLTVSRLMPILAVLSIVAGGLMMILSAGRPERFMQGKNIIRWAFTAYILTLLAWLVITIAFSLFGIAKWTGFTPERGDIMQLSGKSLTVGSPRFQKNAWKEYAVEIRSPEGEKVIRKITSNTSDTLILDESQPFPRGPGYRYHILHTGWWNFVCGISAPVGADFAASPDSGIAAPSFMVDFTDLSEGDEVTSWSWDFGDGKTSNLQSPKHTYTTDGPHTVRLTVTGPDGSDRKTKTIYYAPTAEFSASPLHGRTPLEVQFQDASTGQVTAWSWDFDGDNEEDSKEQNPIYTYSDPGPYRVKLTVSGPGGRDVESTLNYVFVYPAPPEPVADFATSTAPGDFLELTTKNLSFEPGNSTLDDITSWEWDFGNKKGTSAVESPTYFYETSAQPYTITLKAIGPGGKNSIRTTVAFVPGANFTADKTSGVVPLTLRFKDSSTGTVSGLTWDFGDGSALESTELGASISHPYTKNGVYAVTLKAEGPAGENAFTRDAYIAVAPKAGFSYSSVSYPSSQIDDFPRLGSQNCRSSCTVGPSGATVIFKNNSDCAGSCISYWEFGDGGFKTVNGLGDVTYTYKDKSETFTVRLTVTGPGGSNTTEEKNYIKIAPWAVISPKEFKHTHTITLGCGESLPPGWPPAISKTFSDKSQPQAYIETTKWSTGETGPPGSFIVREFNPGSSSVSLTAINARGQRDSASASVQIFVDITHIPCPPPPPAGGGASAKDAVVLVKAPDVILRETFEAVKKWLGL